MRIVRDIISENFIITLLGAIVGWMLALLFMSSYTGLYSSGWLGIVGDTPTLGMLLNWRMVLAVIAVCFIINILSASVPALQASRLNTVDAINGRHNN